MKTSPLQSKHYKQLYQRAAILIMTSYLSDKTLTYINGIWELLKNTTFKIKIMKNWHHFFGYFFNFI